MGIVLKQSLNNTIITYVGFAIGALNHLFLFTTFLSADYFGLVTVVLAVSNILMPIIAFGVPITMVKFFSSFLKNEETDSFLTLMLLLPLLILIPLTAFLYFSDDFVGDLLSKRNGIVKNYVWYIFIIGVAMAYFEIFYAWAKVHMKSVFGNLMKEVFVRMGTTVLLLLIYWNTITIAFFFKALVGLYIFRMLIMKFYAYRQRAPKLNFNWPKNARNIIKYTVLIIIGASASVVLLEVDKVMLNQFKAIENVAYYGVAVYIAVVIGVPSRSMQQITSPLTAKLMNEDDRTGLKTLYHKSSLTLFIISGILFLLILLNVSDLYLLIPEAYSGGITIISIIGLIKVYDALLGINNAILYNSNYYRAVLLMGLLLAILTIFFNYLLIPRYGIEGAAIASFLAFFIFNTIKLRFVKIKFGILPFSKETLKVLCFLILLGTGFYFINFSFHPIFNIVLKSVLMILIYGYLLYKFNVSEDINQLVNKLISQVCAIIKK